jgi:PPOX class probable F420-dependent enzyme
MPLTAELTDGDIGLLRGKNFAHVAVIRPDGSPHVTVMWVDASDDGRVLLNSAVGRVKDRYLRRDPRVSVTVHQEGDAYTWLRVDGSVEKFVTGDEAEGHIDALNRRYKDGDAWDYTPGQVRVMYRVRPDRILRRHD